MPASKLFPTGLTTTAAGFTYSYPIPMEQYRGIAFDMRWTDTINSTISVQFSCGGATEDAAPSSFTDSLTNAYWHTENDTNWTTDTSVSFSGTGSVADGSRTDIQLDGVTASYVRLKLWSGGVGTLSGYYNLK